MVDPDTINTLTDKQFFLMLGACLVVVQVLYRIWEKRDTKLVIDAITAMTTATNTSIHETIASLEPHLERGRKVYGMLKDLQSMHSVRDDDGRFIWYMPKEIIETQRELTRLTHTVATTQGHMLKIMERQEAQMLKHQEEIKHIIGTHQEDCKDQYHNLKDIIT